MLKKSIPTLLLMFIVSFALGGCGSEVSSSGPEESSTTKLSTCGNGVLDGEEQCEGTDLGGEACVSRGFESGTLSCTDQCLFDTSSCRAAFGTPVISEVAGVASNNRVVTLRGENFGSKAEASPLKYDDFEAGSDGEFIMDIQPEWKPYKNKGAKYSSDRPYSGQLSAFNNPAYGPNGEWHEFDTNYFNYGPTERIYLSYYFRTNDADLGSDRGVVKLTRITSLEANGTVYNGIGGFTMAMNPLYGEGIHVQGFNITREYNTLYQDINEWVRIEVELEKYFEGGPLGRIAVKTIGHSSYEGTNVDMTIEGSDWEWDSVLMGLMVANQYQTVFQVHMDDIYVDNTFARVELGNAPIFEDCTKREVQVPKKWTEGEIEVTFKAGGFLPGEVAYLFVVNGDRAISAGLPVVME